MILSSVLLPHPLGPTMETKLPASISKDTRSSAVTARAPLVNTRETSSTAISDTWEPERMNAVHRLINWLVNTSFAVTFRPISKYSLMILTVLSVISGLMKPKPD